jgi:maleate isomerase
VSNYRLGLIVPSSNVTMETELPELFRRREAIAPERFSFHSARMRMTQVTPEALAAMDEQGVRCAVELADAECAALAYACLVAVMAAGPGAHQRAETRLAVAAGSRTPVVTSAGALIGAARRLGAERIAMLAPYAPALTERVVEYLGDAGIEVVSVVSLGVTDNCAVGRLDPAGLLDLIGRLDLDRAQALVLSACVQMPSLASIEAAQERTGLPVFSAATATARALLDALHLDPHIPGAGALLAGELQPAGAASVAPRQSS